jgi:hypothetical protein
MINYPLDFPPAARARVERALADAEDQFIAASAGAGPVRSALPGDITYVGMWDRSDRAAVCYVLEVLETVVQASCDVAREHSWSADRLRTTTASLVAQLTESTFEHKHSQRDGTWGAMTLADFTTIVHRELRALPFWSELQVTIRQLSALTTNANDPVGTPPRSSPATQEQLRKREAWLTRELERRGMNPTSLRTAGGPDRKTTLKILSGVAVTENVLRRIAAALNVNRTEIP